VDNADPNSVVAGPSFGGTRVLFGYGLNYLIDVKHAVIVDVEARFGGTM
jgi:hypothetical protein